jgi:hypothetical protein
MLRAIYLGVLISIFTIAIAIPAMAQPVCENEMAKTYQDLLITSITDTDAPVVLLAAANPDQAPFRETTDKLISKFAKDWGYRFVTEMQDAHPSALLGDRLLQFLTAGGDNGVIDELKAKASKQALVVLETRRFPIVTINNQNSMTVERQAFEKLQQLAADWKKEGVNVRFFMRTPLQTPHATELNFSLTPREAFPYWDATPAPFTSPVFINIGRAAVAIVYPN